MKTLPEIAREVVARTIYLTLATATRQGVPWCSPVACAFNEAYEFFWCSGSEARHSRNIADNSVVAAVLYDTTAREGSADADTTSLYMEGTAALLEPGRVAEALRLMDARFGKDSAAPLRAEDFTGAEAEPKVYVFQPTAFWLLKPEGDSRYKNFVDCREVVDIFGRA